MKLRFGYPPVCRRYLTLCISVSPCISGHSDHYTGIRESWNQGKIYCSAITAAVVQQKLQVGSSSKMLKALRTRLTALGEGAVEEQLGEIIRNISDPG
eukprot:7589939-Pyramimonas_sp.AAC.2